MRYLGRLRGQLLATLASMPPPPSAATAAAGLYSYQHSKGV